MLGDEFTRKLFQGGYASIRSLEIGLQLRLVLRRALLLLPQAFQLEGT